MTFQKVRCERVAMEPIRNVSVLATSLDAAKLRSYGQCCYATRQVDSENVNKTTNLLNLRNDFLIDSHRLHHTS